MAGAVAALFVIVALGADGEPPPSELPVVLTWDAPAECPTADALEAEIGRLAGRTATPPPVKPEARATVRRGHGDTWQLTLATRAGAFSGERKLTAASCVELMQAAALVVALMINPAAGGAAPPVVVTAPPPPPPPPPPKLRRFAVGGEVAVGTGALPGAAVGVGLRLTAGGARFHALLRGTAWASRRATSPSDASAGGSFDLFDVGLGACARWWRDRRVSPGLCAGAAVLRTHATGFGVSDPGQATAWWNAAFLGGEVRVMLTPRNGLHLGIEALASGGRPTFGLAGVGSVYRPAPIAARGSVGWEVCF